MLYVIGSLFHSTPNAAERWHRKDCLLADATLQLVNEDDMNATSGKLFSGF